MHFPANLLRDSPTTIGLISGGEPSLFLFRAISLPPAMNLDTARGAFPDTKRFTTSLREEVIGVWSGTDITSRYVEYEDQTALPQCLWGRISRQLQCQSLNQVKMGIVT